MKKTILITLISILLVIPMTDIAIANPITNVKIHLNGNPLNIPESLGSPFIDNQSRTMIPLRAVSEGLGHNVSWNNNTFSATIDRTVKVTINSNVVETPNGNIQMDTFAVLGNDGRTYVPLRFVVEALGNYEISYEGPKNSNNFHHTVNIITTNSKEETPQQPVTDDFIEPTFGMLTHEYFSTLGITNFRDYFDDSEAGGVEYQITSESTSHPAVNVQVQSLPDGRNRTADYYKDVVVRSGGMGNASSGGVRELIRIPTGTQPSLVSPKTGLPKQGETVTFKVTVRRGNEVKTYTPSFRMGIDNSVTQ